MFNIIKKLHSVFVWKFQGLLRRKFATNVSRFVQYYESLRKWHDFWFLMRYFEVNAQLTVQTSSTTTHGLQTARI